MEVNARAGDGDLLVDEATQARVLDEILAFAAGRTLLLATHSPAVAARFARVLRVADAKVKDA